MLKYFTAEHAAYGLLIQLGIGVGAYMIGLCIAPSAILLSVSAWIGMAVASTFFISREYSQREYVLGIVGHAKWYQGFTGWDAKSIGDVLSPTAVCATLALIATYG